MGIFSKMLEELIKYGFRGCQWKINRYYETSSPLIPHVAKLSDLRQIGNYSDFQPGVTVMKFSHYFP